VAGGTAQKVLDRYLPKKHPMAPGALIVTCTAEAAGERQERIEGNWWFFFFLVLFLHV